MRNLPEQKQQQKGFSYCGRNYCGRNDCRTINLYYPWILTWARICSMRKQKHSFPHRIHSLAHSNKHAVIFQKYFVQFSVTVRSLRSKHVQTKKPTGIKYNLLGWLRGFLLTFPPHALCWQSAPVARRTAERSGGNGSSGESGAAWTRCTCRRMGTTGSPMQIKHRLDTFVSKIFPLRMRLS